MEQKFWEYYQDIITGQTSTKTKETCAQCRYHEAREYIQKTMDFISQALVQFSFPLSGPRH